MGTVPTNPQPSGMFSEAKPERAFPLGAVLIASVAVLVLVGFFVAMGRRHSVPTNTVLPLAAYAPSLAMSGIQMSESTSLSGGKSTYVDGHVANQGTATVTGVTVQVLFRNDEAMPPQVFTLPLTLIRTRQPYVDTEPVSAEPLAPGADREFRLIFESIGANWNQQLPEIHVISVQTR